MKGFGGGMAQLMKQANQMQIRMKKAQEELAQRTYKGSSGGGAVEVVVNGDSMVQKVSISPEVLKDSDAEMLQDLLVSATNDAIRTAKAEHAAEMQKITGGMQIPGLS